MIRQKSFNSDHINKKKIINRGELPRYFVEDSHEPIIDKATFDMVQQELARRAKLIKINEPAKEYPFTSKIICDKCGKNYRRKIGNAGSKYAKPIWICSTFNTLGKNYCSSQQIPEEILNEIVPKDFKEIHIPEPNTLHVIMQDNTLLKKTWEHKARN